MPVKQVLSVLFDSETSDHALNEAKIATTPASWTQLASQLTALQTQELFREIVSRLSQGPASQQSLFSIRAFAAILGKRPDFSMEIAPHIVAQITSAYRVTPANSSLRGTWLAWLATAQTTESLQAWVDLVADDPPQDEQAIPPAIAPLLKFGDLPPEFYARLLQAPLTHPQLAPVLIDLMNYQFRNQIRLPHPGLPHVSMLANLLNAAVQELRRVEVGDLPKGRTPEQTRRAISDAVALVISLCDAIGLCGDDSHVDELHNASQLRHRQIQAEAAAALARLGDETGTRLLIKLAAEPVARLRVLNYAAELGLQDEIPESFQTDLALAESQLANWLSDPSRFGIAPGLIELVEARELYWPSYEHPILCYLFRFRYATEGGGYENLALVGPLVHAFQEDIRWLDLEDAFAAFAGWQAEHPEIYQMNLDQAHEHQPDILAELLKSLKLRDIAEVTPELLGNFFGEWILVASASTQHGTGFAITNGQSFNWFGNHDDCPLSAAFAYMIYRGRRLLRAFNEQT